MDYCFLLSVYKNTELEAFKVCLDSCINQTLKPDKIVIVVDGSVSDEMNDYLTGLEKLTLYIIVRLPHNMGLGLALNEGMSKCDYEFIARMDTDDVCALDRCEKQINCFKSNPWLSVVGSNIAEFNGDINNVVSYRNVPENHEQICEFMKKRCPMNHMTVMLKKSEVEKAGGYQHWFYNEDSYLWVRMYLQGCQFHNIQENLVFARIDQSTFKRRGGLKYYRSERDLFKYMYKHKIIGFFAYQKAKFIRFVVQILMPNSVRQWFFKTFAREEKSKKL